MATRHTAERGGARRGAPGDNAGVETATRVVAIAYIRASRPLITRAGTSAKIAAAHKPPRSPAHRRPRAAPTGTISVPATADVRRSAVGVCPKKKSET